MTTWVDEIVGDIELGDPRRNQRLRTLLQTLVKRPAESIPQACNSWAETLAAYRFFSNDAIAPEAIIAGLTQATLARCQGQPYVLAIQDTTTLDYSHQSKTSGLGPLETAKQRGLMLHTTLAVGANGVPLGILDHQCWARDPTAIGSRHQRQKVPVEGKESAKWLRALQRTEALVGERASVITVADREADLYELYALAQTLKGSWLIRARHNRRLVGEEKRLLRAVEQAPLGATVTVELPRADNRPARTAILEVRWCSVVLRPPKRNQAAISQWWAAHPATEQLSPAPLKPLRVGAILVSEAQPPVGQQPVSWLLLTNLPLGSLERVIACIEYYRLRWLVERYHFVLKSGCRIEHLQLEEVERLQRALAVYVGVAWRLLWLTYEARARPEAPCSVVFATDEWRLLAAMFPQLAQPSGQPPTLGKVVRQIAQLGGFLSRQGDGQPGVKTLWRGLKRLEDRVMTYRFLRDHPELLSVETTCV